MTWVIYFRLRADLGSRFRKTSFGHSFVGLPDLARHVSTNLFKHSLLLDALVHDVMEEEDLQLISPITLAGLSPSQLSLYSKKQLTLFFLADLCNLGIDSNAKFWVLV